MPTHPRRVPLLLLAAVSLLALLPLLGGQRSTGAAPRSAHPAAPDAAVAADPRADFGLVYAGMEGETLAPWLRSAAQLDQVTRVGGELERPPPGGIGHPHEVTVTDDAPGLVELGGGA